MSKTIPNREKTRYRGKTKCPHCGSRENELYDTTDHWSDNHDYIYEIKLCKKCGLYFMDVFNYMTTVTIPNRDFRFNDRGADKEYQI